MGVFVCGGAGGGESMIVVRASRRSVVFGARAHRDCAPCTMMWTQCFVIGQGMAVDVNSIKVNSLTPEQVTHVKTMGPKQHAQQAMRDGDYSVRRPTGKLQSN